MDQRSDGKLLDAWIGGDSGAFEALVHRHEGPLLRHARALLADWRGGEDVVQEALLRLARKPPELPAEVRGDPGAERAVLASWLHRVTRNLCMDAMRSEKRRKRREETAATSEAISGGLQEVEGRDTRDAVERSLTKLPADQREVLVLRLLGERSYREIAEITGRKIGTIGWLISVGLKALAEELAPLLAMPESHGSPGVSRTTGASGAPITNLQGEPS
jgi:RNA polymerase sigma-70 factor, ECF subfamily